MHKQFTSVVSILVIMEVTLKCSEMVDRAQVVHCFNPCYNGSNSKIEIESVKFREAIMFQSYIAPVNK